MKSMCQDARRNSPSVADWSPTSSCLATISRIASSSTPRSSAASIRPASKSARASSSRRGRSRLPTWSARNGGFVRRPAAAGVEASCCIRFRGRYRAQEHGEERAMATIESTAKEFQQFIGGEWADAVEGQTFDDLDPFTGDVVARIPNGTREDARRAVEAAAAAFESWWQTPPAVRQGIFLKAADILESRQDEVVSWLARETGSTFRLGQVQMHL